LTSKVFPVIIFPVKVSADRMLEARFQADMSRADLAAALRNVTGGRVKASERGIRGWEKGEYTPSANVIPAYALATDKPLDFFYAADPADDAPFPGSRRGHAGSRRAV
jgi:transcriptional regulator with XRE-family HTH domain